MLQTDDLFIVNGIASTIYVSFQTKIAFQKTFKKPFTVSRLSFRYVEGRTWIEKKVGPRVYIK